MVASSDVLLLGGVRTPFGKFGGALRAVPSVELAAVAMKAALGRTALSGGDIDEVYYGTCMAAEVALVQNVPARQAVLFAGMPPETVSVTVDRACCSSTTAVQLACRAIAGGAGQAMLAVGVENMSNVPLLVPDSRWGHRPGGLKLTDPLANFGYPRYTPVALDTGEVAVERGVTREMQDAWALQSQQRYARALAEGFFDGELTPVPVPGRKGETLRVAADEFPRPDTTLAALAKLPTVNGSPTCTAGNAPGYDAGAAALVLSSPGFAAARGLQPLARIRTTVSVAMEPRRLAEAPALAIRKALDQAGLTLADLDLIEINEAFAAVPLVSTRLLSNGDDDLWQRLQAITNVNGGAVAIGHPVGASGARLVLTLAREMRRRGARFGVAAICGGLAQADAIVLAAPGA